MFHGKLELVDDFETFDAETYEEFEVAFHDAVDDYIQFCAEIGKEPEKP